MKEVGGKRLKPTAGSQLVPFKVRTNPLASRCEFHSFGLGIGRHRRLSALLNIFGVDLDLTFKANGDGQNDC